MHENELQYILTENVELIHLGLIHLPVINQFNTINSNIIYSLN